MKYKFFGKNITVTPAIKNYSKKALDKLNKYFTNNKDIECRVVVRTYSVGTKAEINIYLQNMLLRAEVKNDDLYAAIDLAVDKLAGQIRKLKTKLKNKNIEGISFNNIEDTTETIETPTFVKNKIITAQKMSLDDAIMNMEALGHSFYIFVDQDNQKLTIVYKREDGNYASIEIKWIMKNKWQWNKKIGLKANLF